jgi:membrane protein YdbS with pleckstrin-like domain
VPVEVEDANDIERRNIKRLLRWVAAFVAWPSLTIGLAFLVFTDPSDHWLHIGGLVPLGLAAIVLFVMAPQLAKKWVP